MIEFGETLRKTREAKGLTLSEVAQKTHMLVQQVEALEKEDFSKIAAPIYGRGFVKLYCEAVGIEDYKPLVDEFMDIYSGNKPPTIRMRNMIPSPDPEDVSETAKKDLAFDEMTPIQHDENIAAEDDDDDAFSAASAIDASVEDGEPEEFQSQPAEDLFDFAREPETRPLPKPKQKSALKKSIDDFFKESGTQATPLQNSGPARYSTPRPIEDGFKKSFNIPPVAIRLGILAIGAILILWLLIYGMVAVYRAAVGPETEETTEAATTEIASPESSGSQSTTGSSQRTPMKLKHLYVD